MKSIFEKLCFRDGLVWTVDVTVEIKLRFHFLRVAWTGPQKSHVGSPGQWFVRLPEQHQQYRLVFIYQGRERLVGLAKEQCTRKQRPLLEASHIKAILKSELIFPKLCICMHRRLVQVANICCQRISFEFVLCLGSPTVTVVPWTENLYNLPLSLKEMLDLPWYLGEIWNLLLAQTIQVHGSS